jgi:hypothetical protein
LIFGWHQSICATTREVELKMKRETARRLTSVAILTVLAMAFSLVANAQYASSSKPKSNAPSKGTPTLTAKLIDPEKKAQQKAATVDVRVTGIRIIDPARVNEQPRAGQGHLHYQVDDGPIIATTTTKLSFHGLTPGPHKIVVMLAGNDHNPLGPQEILNVTIP